MFAYLMIASTKGGLSASSLFETFPCAKALFFELFRNNYSLTDLTRNYEEKICWAVTSFVAILLEMYSVAVAQTQRAVTIDTTNPVQKPPPPTSYVICLQRTPLL
jgi:hypothetical protein